MFFRIFSRNLARRRAENQRFVNWWWRMKSSRQGARERHADKDHKYFTCKNCRNHLPGAGGQGEHRHHLSQMRGPDPGQDVTMALRFASAADAAALLAIYGQYLDTPVTFEQDLPSEAEFARRIASYGGTHPYLVWEEGGRPVGYAYAHQLGERTAYQWSAELSVYLDRGWTARGDRAAALRRPAGAAAAPGRPDSLRVRHGAQSGQRGAPPRPGLPDGGHLAQCRLQVRRLAGCGLV